MDYMLDTKRDTTLDGSPRCDYCYKGIDDYDDVEWMRCTEPATTKVRVTSRGKSYDAIFLCGVFRSHSAAQGRRFG